MTARWKGLPKSKGRPRHRPKQNTNPNGNRIPPHALIVARRSFASHQGKHSVGYVGHGGASHERRAAAISPQACTA
jgi:hypothetical protein